MNAQPWKEPLFLPETDSTNLALRRLAAEGAREGTALWAARQSAGRGRLGRSFASPEGGLYYSLLLEQSAQPERDLLLTPAAAVAVARTLRALCALESGIKWPNDLLSSGGGKLCGILTESFLAGGRRFMALGIGVNLNTRAFPAELDGIAESVYRLTGRDTPLADFARSLTRQLQGAVAQARDGGAALLADYRARCVNLGREVVILRGDTAENARALAVNEDFSLAVVHEDGRREDLRCGEVSLRPRQGVYKSRA